jgi:hypothetical protein
MHPLVGEIAYWAYHGEEGWYIGPSMHHYRCVQCFMPTTSKVRDVDTVDFFPTTIPFPSVSTEDYLRLAAGDVLNILRSPPASLPSLSYGDATKNALVQIAQLLGQATPPTPAHVDPPRVPTPVQPPRVQEPIQKRVQTPIVQNGV